MTSSGAGNLLATSTLLMFLTAICYADKPVALDLKDSSPEQKQLERWWADLEKDEPDASKALLNFAARPDTAVSFFKSKLRPLRIGNAPMRALLAELGSADESIWKPAFVELEYYDPRLAIGLETLMDEVTESPTRQRLTEVLSGRPAGSMAGKTITLRRTGSSKGFNFYNGRGSWWAEHRVAMLVAGISGNNKKKWTRAIRALVLLDHIGTPDALAIVEDIAGGHPDAQPTKVAQGILASRKAEIR